MARLRLAYASCPRWEHGYYAAYRHMLAEQVDAVAFLGDYIYEYPNARGAVRVPTGGWVVTLDDYRQRYALHKSDTDLQAMHAACPWLVIWDDHEVQNDYAGLQAGDSGPQLPSSVSGFAGRRAAAYQACEKTAAPSAQQLPRGTLLFFPDDCPSGWSRAPDARQAKGTVVHFHGNAQNMSSHWQFVGWLARRGYNVFVFDYRGYGDSAGHAELQGVYADSHSALDYVRSRADVDPTRLLVLGQSLGGTNAIAVVGSGNRAGAEAGGP